MDEREIVDLVDALEGEVNNGGFHQFFYNNAGGNTMETIRGLEAIGAVKVADILKRAAAMFPGGMPPKDRFARQGVLLATFPDARSFEVLNDEFYAYLEDISGLLRSYKSRSGL